MFESAVGIKMLYWREIKTPALPGLAGGSILALKPRYVPAITGPRGAGDSNDWCIKRNHNACQGMNFWQSNVYPVRMRPGWRGHSGS